MTEEKKVRPPTTISTDDNRPDEPKVGTPVDVDSDTTPITRQPVEQVDASQWDKLHLTQLHQQLDILMKRLSYAQSIGHADMITQIQRGVAQLQSIIKTRNPEDKLI